jgi:GAF domain-containing protein
LQLGLFIVPDTTLDHRFCENALVVGDPHSRFYAGALLETPEGFPLGTVCVLDYKIRELDETQKAFLRLMAHQVMKASRIASDQGRRTCCQNKSRRTGQTK